MKSPVEIDDLLAYLKKHHLITALELTSCDKTIPHHFHDKTDTLHSSPLQGDVFADLDIVLSQIKDMIQQLELSSTT